MTRRVALFVMALAIALAAMPAPGAVASDSANVAPAYFGWWYRLNTPPLGSTAPAPPDTPPGGLYLTADPTGALAVSALHFTDTGSGDATMTLRAAAGSTFLAASVVACPTKGEWNPATAGGWASQPQPDCGHAGAGVSGVASSDGMSMSWKLTSAFQPTPSSYDVVLLPKGPVPFRVAVPLPGADTLAAPVPAVPTAPEEPSPSPAPDNAGAGDIGSSTVAPSVPVASSPARAATGASRRPSTVRRFAPTNPARSTLAKVADSRAERVLAATALSLLAAALWWFGGQQQRGPRLLGSLGEPGAPATPAPAAVVGGIGRFARPRAGRPQPLT